MTEDEWLAFTEPYSMLDALRSTDSWDEGKVRLFACWCARQVWHLLLDTRSREAVEVAERFAARPFNSGELAAAQAAAMEAVEDAEAGSAEAWSAAQAAAAAATTVEAAWAEGETAETAAGTAARYAAGAAAAAAAAAKAGSEAIATAVEQAQADMLREMFGNPFRPDRATR